MNHGRFLKMIFPMIDLMVRSFGEAGGGVDGDGITDQGALDAMFDSDGASPDGGKVETDTPAAEKDASGKTETGEEGKGDGTPSDKEKAFVVTDDDLEKALAPDESPAEKAARLERDYKASSSEAQRLNAEKKAIAKSLEEQGLKLVVKDGKVDLIPTGKYSSDAKPFQVKVDQLSATDQEILESGDLSEIQKVIDRVVEDARSKLVRPAPTREKEAPSISEEKKAAVFNSLAEAKNEFDLPKHENLKENRKTIENFIKNPAQPEALRDLFAEKPELVAVLVNSHVNSVRAGLLKAAEAAKAASDKKKSEARNRADAGAGDEGNVAIGTGGGAFLDSVGQSRFR